MVKFFKKELDKKRKSVEEKDGLGLGKPHGSEEELVQSENTLPILAGCALKDLRLKCGWCLWTGITLRKRW